MRHWGLTVQQWKVIRIAAWVVWVPCAAYGALLFFGKGGGHSETLQWTVLAVGFAGLGVALWTDRVINTPRLFGEGPAQSPRSGR